MARTRADEYEAMIVDQYGYFLNIRQVGQFLNFKNRDAVKRFMDGVPVCNMGKEKKWFARDVAKRISAQMEM